jgi:hypothetical protein
MPVSLNIKMYVNVKPNVKYDNLLDLAMRIERLLGPAIPDESAWGLDRPGLVGPEAINRAHNIWRIHNTYVSEKIRLMGSWIVFDYLFSKIAKANPLITCLTLLGLAKYEKRVILKNTYLVTVELNPEKGIMIFLYKGGPSIEKDLDSLAYVISHIMKSHSMKKVVIDLETLTNAAYELNNSTIWKWTGWITKEGETIPGEIVKSKWKGDYEVKLKKGEWRMLEFEGRFGRIRLSLTERRKRVNVILRKNVFELKPKRSLKPIFDELSRILKPYKLTHLTYDQSDEAGILRAYTERRGIVATENIVKEEYGVNARDVSYEFRGYDIEAGEKKIEVKAFRNGDKTIELTENEYKKMYEEGYEIFIVENAWNDNPKVNIIEDPKRLEPKGKERGKPKLAIETETYYEVKEDKWRKEVNKQKLGKV